MDEFRYRPQQSPRTEGTMNNLVSPPRNGGPRMAPVPTHDHRTSLPRRFTTDSGRVPTLSSIAQRPPEPQEYPTATQYKAQNQYKAQLLEKKKAEYDQLMEQKRRFELEMQQLSDQQRMEEMEFRHMRETVAGNGPMGITGHQSEPTTPPEYRENATGFPTMFSRPNRYSTSSLVSPQSFFNRSGQSGSQLTSPRSSAMQTQRFAYDDQMPSRSVPASRRNSDDDDEKEAALRQDPTSHRSTNATNRYSMPVTRRGGNLYDNIDQTNAAGFLFRDDDSAMDSTYTAVDTGEDGFPKLYQHKANPNRLSASSVAVDLATLEANNGWNKMSSLHRPQHSLSQLTSSQMSSADAGPAGQAGASSEANALASRPPGFRHSLDLNNHNVNVDLGYYPKETPAEVAAPLMSPPASQVLSTPPKLQTSFSANDIPTVKNPASGNSAAPNANAHAQQHFHNHNASIGRIPLGAVPNRHSRELSSDSHIGVTQSATFPSIGSTLHGNAPSFGPPVTQSQMQQQQQQQHQQQGPQQQHQHQHQPHPPQSTPPSGPVSSPGSGGSTGQYPSFYPPAYNQTSPNGSGYNVNMLAMGMGGMNINGYPSQNYTGYAPMYQSTQNRGDSQQRVINQRRAQDNEAMARFQNLTLQDIGGEIYSLCKDQHGCRFLQKQLESRNPQSIHMIWLETKAYVVELMVDPFGNYLCQKLLEYCTDDERTTLIENAAPHMVRIALNQHGTRALQKMIEFVSIPQHVQIIVNALRYQVVDLIQDLNGNHVIQKCLNKLSAEDAQFIFDAVGNHCIEVGTHRHGCCVLQRCIDHASGDQKIWLVGRITSDALRLVQDPFGNYVVQYIIDLNEPAFTEPVVKMFAGRIPQLSRHKFSSNVIEKCLRCASDGSRDMMISEIVVPGEMEKLIRDSFGNYVVQTALEHATFHMKQQLVETIRPILPAIRTTPHGRRIQTKIQAFDQRSGSNSGQTTPADATGGQISLRQGRAGLANPNALMNPGGYPHTMNSNPRGQMPYPTTANLAVPPPQPPRLNPGFTYPGASMQPGAGEGQFF